jgi:tetratricopeptide (TPR) repeat protein
MKLPYSILGLAGIAGILLATGCASPAHRPVPGSAGQSAAAVVPPITISDDFLADDAAETAARSSTNGNADAFAHYAAGISFEWNDEDELALKQFDLAALADPSNEGLVIKVAQRYLKTKRYDKAIALLAKSAKRPDASGLLLSWLARANLQAGKTRDALTASRQAIQHQPGGFDGYESQVEIYFRQGRWSDALHTLNRAARAIHPEPEVMVNLCGLYSAYLKAQPKDGAARTNTVALLDRVAKMNFPSTRLWTAVADIYTQAGQPKKAVAIYIKLLSQTPEPSVVRESLHEKLAGIYFEAEDKTNATKQLEAIVRDNPTRYPRAWFFLGELAYEDDKLAEAVDDYENALHWDPGMAEAYFKLVLVQLDLHRTEDAFKTLAVARARFPKTFLCECYTGIAYLHDKRYAEAIHHFTEAEVIGLATDPNALDYRFYFQFGEACERNQDLKRADECLQKCINLSPDFSEALNYLGYMLADSGQQLLRARALIEKAVALEPKNGAYLDSLAWVLFKLKQPQQALPWALKAMKYTPEADATVLDHLGEIYMALHEPAKAIEAWKKSLSIESNPDVKKKLDSYSGGA